MMYIKKVTGYICDNGFQEYSTKGLFDTYKPPTIPSNNYKNWIAILDLRTCAICRQNHGKIYLIDETVYEEPPVHQGCRCEIKIMNAIISGQATLNGLEGYRNSMRILYSNDGLIFVTYDHYKTFYEIV